MYSDTKYVVKDLISNEYMRWGGRGDSSNWVNTTPHLEHAFLYDSKGPATAFINQHNKRINNPHTVDLNNLPPHYKLVVVEIEVAYKEI